jgi:hypothetical protein
MSHVDLDQVQDPVTGQQAEATNTMAWVTTVDWSRPVAL